MRFPGSPLPAFRAQFTPYLALRVVLEGEGAGQRNLKLPEGPEQKRGGR